MLCPFSSLLQYTISGKKVEVAVKKIISGESVDQRGALANPSSLDLYYDIPELQLPTQPSPPNTTAMVNGHSAN